MHQSNFFGLFSVNLMAALVCEKFDAKEEALAHADQALVTDLAKGGILAALPRILAHCVRGRVLAGQTQLEQATEAFEAAIKEAQTAGWRLLELFALRDLKLGVLDKTRKGDEGSQRIGKVLRMLKGQGCVHCRCAARFCTSMTGPFAQEHSGVRQAPGRA